MDEAFKIKGHSFPADSAQAKSTQIIVSKALNLNNCKTKITSFKNGEYYSFQACDTENDIKPHLKNTYNSTTNLKVFI